MPFPAKLSIVINGRDPKKKENITEIFYKDACASLEAGMVAARSYADWRQGKTAKGLTITEVRVSADDGSKQSDVFSSFQNGEGNDVRDVLATGYRIRLSDTTRKYRSERVFRGLIDINVRYEEDGTEANPASSQTTVDSLVTKLVSLGLSMRSISRELADTKPCKIDSFTVVDNVLVGFVSAQLAALDVDKEGTRVTIAGCKGILAGGLNGVYTIAHQDTNNFLFTPQKVLSPGVAYIGGSGKVLQRKVIYPAIVRGDFRRYGSRKTGGGNSRRRGRHSQVLVG